MIRLRSFATCAIRYIVGFLSAATLAAVALTGSAFADPIRIVAIGASNTAGYHAGGQGWTDQLQAMLRAKGYEVSMTVAGVVGDTSKGILSRVDSAVPAGTQVVIYDVGGGNDKDTGAGGSTNANKALIAQRIRAKGAKPIFANYPGIVGSEASNRSAWRANDSHHHLTVQSHARVAASLMPQVIAAVGKRK